LYSWYTPRWWYPYYDASYFYYGDWGWGGWGAGASFYYSPSYYNPGYYGSYESYEPAMQVTERVADYGTTEDFPSPDVDEAKRLFDDGRYSEAAEMYRRLSLAYGSDPFVRLAHAHCLLADGRYEYAAYVVRKAIGLNPDWEQVFMQLRAYYADWAIYADHVEELERYIAEKPSNTATRFLLGYTYLFWGRYRDSAGVFRSLQARQPEDNGVSYFLGMTESLGKRPETSS
jgi:tetratricopeptide (TPR) repeat protein